MTNHSMFHRPAKLLAVSGLLVAALLAGQTAFAQTIVGSRHDLTSTGTGSIKQTSTTDICVFCHTPHGAAAIGPLWNKTAPAGPFTLYASPAMDSTALSATGSTSVMCLSCHDGVGSFDNMINKAGSGGYNAGGSLAGYTWVGGVTTHAGSSAFVKMGLDLSNDHQIGAAYCGGFTAGACRDAAFKIATLNRKVGAVTTTGTGAATTGGALTDSYWVDSAGGSVGVREKTDMILYTRTYAVPAGNFPSVECASCHDPHNPVYGTFLRMSNAASAMCITCHSK